MEILTKKFLKKEYIKNKRSSVSIAKEVKCSCGTVVYYLRKYNISVRSISEGTKVGKVKS